MRAGYGQVLVVDNGGYFPEQDTHRDVAWFVMDAMKVLGTDAVGLSEKDLRFGLAFITQQQKRTQLPIVSANLFRRDSKKTVFPAYLVKQIGGVKVGVFGLMSDKVPLGPAQDSLRVEEPAAAARRTIAELRKKGVGAIVLLSQLGKVESEDLAAAVPGIDALIVGHNVAVLPKGRMIKTTVASYGGEQGQYMGRTVLNLDAKRKASGGDAETYMLGPEIPDKPEVAKLVKGFEDGFNEKLRKAEKDAAVAEKAQREENKDHFLGADLCMRCHVDEGEQWKTTSHSLAWQTLVVAKKDATPDCIPCHVVGYKQPGGFQSGADSTKLANVQCENCHGMGTQHDAFAAAPRRITEQTCVTCHHGENDPEFNFGTKLPKIAHSNLSGETIKAKKTGSGAMMKGHSSSH
ncbi:MAG TPA: multiheme c-type cytochrome [Candidatus Limnocylindria bacterium]|nr:multiheme c-type cytochrome [Candidatus Limnocylindria bacterium]